MIFYDSNAAATVASFSSFRRCTCCIVQAPRAIARVARQRMSLACPLKWEIKDPARHRIREVIKTALLPVDIAQPADLDTNEMLKADIAAARSASEVRAAKLP